MTWAGRRPCSLNWAHLRNRAHQAIDSTVLGHLDGVAVTLLNYEQIGEEWADSLGYANT